MEATKARLRLSEDRRREVDVILEAVRRRDQSPDAEAVYARQRLRLDQRLVSSLARRFGVSDEWRALRRRVDRILKERP